MVDWGFEEGEEKGLTMNEGSLQEARIVHETSSARAQSTATHHGKFGRTIPSATLYLTSHETLKIRLNAYPVLRPGSEGSEGLTYIIHNFDIILPGKFPP